MRACPMCGAQVAATYCTQCGAGNLLSELLGNAPFAWDRALAIVASLCSAVAAFRTTDDSELHTTHILVSPPFVAAREPVEPQLARARSKYGIWIREDYEYRAPERLMGKPLTEAADVYFLGLVAYHLIAGHHPFPNAIGPSGLVTAQLKQQPPALVGVPPEVNALVQRCLRKVAAERFESIAALRDALVAFA